MASITDGQVVWICVANVGLSVLSNSRSLLGRMDYLQHTAVRRLGLRPCFYRGQASPCPVENSHACLHGAASACSTSRRASGDIGSVRATSWPCGDIFFQVFCRM